MKHKKMKSPAESEPFAKGWSPDPQRQIFRQKQILNPDEELSISIDVMAKSKYNGSMRLARFSAFSNLTSYILSLALIFIPLIQLTSIHLAYPEKVLDSLQVFFAVAVLIYSVNSNAAQYEARARSLKESARKLEELSRKLKIDLAYVQDNNGALDLQLFNKMYSEILNTSEDHSRGDFAYATLQTPEMLNESGLRRQWLITKLSIKVRYGVIENYIFSVLLILAVIVVILDMLSVTHVLTRIFNSSI